MSSQPQTVTDRTVKTSIVALCPGQGAQAAGMGRAWCERSQAARAVFDEADAILADHLDGTLSDICFNGPSDRLNRTDVSQPAIYTCSIACFRALVEREDGFTTESIAAAAGLSLGEYTALHLADVFDFAAGLKLVAERGRLMQAAAEASRGGMVALIGAEEEQAMAVCEAAAAEEILVPANFNAPGQIVLSGHASACERAVTVAESMGLRAMPLTVAGAFHSPLMQPAADGLRDTLAATELRPPRFEVWSNVTAEPHDPANPELLRKRLVQQLTSPVRWSQTCASLAAAGNAAVPPHDFRELAPGSVLRGLMRRTDRQIKVTSHDEP